MQTDWSRRVPVTPCVDQSFRETADMKGIVISLGVLILISGLIIEVTAIPAVGLHVVTTGIVMLVSQLINS